jgi:PAS domain S-box-containing protein
MHNYPLKQYSELKMVKYKTILGKEEIVFCNGDIGYRGIVEHINDGVVIIKDDKIVFANLAFYGICQKDPKNILGSKFSEMIIPSEREAVATFLREKIITGLLPDRIEFTMMRPQEEGIMEMKVNVVKCADGLAILAALTDITERRKTRTALQKLKDRLESILHSMNDVVVSVSSNDHSILAINRSAEALYEIPHKDFSSGKRHILEFVHPEDSEKVKHFYKSLPELEFADLSYRIISNNKTVKWVLDEGRIVYANSGRVRRIDHVIRDITEEKKAIEALRQSEEKYRSFFQSTSDMAYVVTPEGTFIDINDAGLKLLGFKNKEEAFGYNITQVYVEPSERKELVDELKAKGSVAGRRVRIKSINGEIIDVAITARAKINDFGKLVHYEGIAHNITKAMEDQRNRVLRNAAGSMCHYMNTHLASLKFSKEFMEQDLQSLEALVQAHADRIPPGDTYKQIEKILVSLEESFSGVGTAYEKMAQVTTAFNSAFLTYKEEAYLDSTILDIFHSTQGKESPDDVKE